jgi:hypothetical protein
MTAIVNINELLFFKNPPHPYSTFMQNFHSFIHSFILYLFLLILIDLNKS